MNLVFDDITAPQRLALTYAAPEFRTHLGFLLSLDARLGAILQKTSEPLIAQMRVAWWNDVLATSIKDRPKGEPLIAILNHLEADEGAWDIAGSARKLTGAWELILTEEIWSKPILGEYATGRAAAIFNAYASMVTADDAQLALVQKAGVDWAIDDLQHYCTDDDRFQAVKAEKSLGQGAPKFSRNLRALSILAKGAQLEQKRGRMTGIYLIWHALTGL